ncbi:hypothetical protein CEUSTIGMA_g8045.t1 [Chlamydomonas eustigma]|uniref:FCP1 homology domain-containing protein n=1 Tax=Chlamydomonas eustigma TaxID=1157962 RepID=A0A250XCX3_9CHLO|nr:hypothetical protein CEUSTIGMA_g8045.t1 [Chlamydomonas eustigma]|eukprot:GAX80610.1 hypothetical protein CEUSTIGMA_g8045.t1 [Chlamydomonas eustigma]
MTECVNAKPAATPPISGNSGAGYYSPSSFMTQASRVGANKRKSNVVERQNPQEYPDIVAQDVKRLRTNSEELQKDEDVPSLESSLITSPDIENVDVARLSSDNARPQQQKGKSMLSQAAACFSPLFGVFQRATTVVASEDVASATATGDISCCQLSGVDENRNERQKVLNVGSAIHRAHHPAPPEVPEAAESDLDEEEDEGDDDFVEFDPLLFIKTLPPLEQCIPKYRPALLPKQTRQCKLKTLVLDLDETLVHSSLEQSSTSDFSFDVRFNNQDHVIHVKKRPHLHLFMETVAKLFEVVVFTASQKVYAEKLLNVIDPKRNLIKFRVYRDSCVMVDGNYLKDLTCLGRDLKSTFIVDNSPQAFGFQPDNGIPIESWYDDEQDDELLKMLPFLKLLSGEDVEDVRPLIASKFRLKELIAKIQL